MLVGEMSTPTQLPSTAEHNPAVCKASRHQRVPFLITADERSLVDLELLLVTLPLCATGRVFVEVPDASWLTDLSVPARMTLTWLDRSRRTGTPGSGRDCARGEALARAVSAWADEMLCDEPASTRIHLLGGYLGTAEIFDHLIGSVGVPADQVRTPEQFGLAPTVTA